MFFFLLFPFFVKMDWLARFTVAIRFPRLYYYIHCDSRRTIWIKRWCDASNRKCECWRLIYTSNPENTSRYATENARQWFSASNIHVAIIWHKKNPSKLWDGKFQIINKSKYIKCAIAIVGVFFFFLYCPLRNVKL